MPELPEVETTRRGLEPYLCGCCIVDVVVRNHRLRLPVDPELPVLLRGRRIDAVARRAKYLLLHSGSGAILLHLGMSGSLRMIESGRMADKHDHIDWLMAGGLSLRLTDPRRFGLALWLPDAPMSHRLLSQLGPEPLGLDWDGAVLWASAQGRRVAIKGLLMDARRVVGVGNIYANEALFMAGIHPECAAGRLSRRRCDRLADAVKTVLTAAIAQGGTTLRDFVAEDGRPGYFKQSLQVYGRADQPCLVCGTHIRQIRQLGRASYYCPRCQH